MMEKELREELVLLLPFDVFDTLDDMASEKELTIAQFAATELERIVRAHVAAELEKDLTDED